MSLKLGKYRHYKGGEYELLMFVLREGSQEPMVVYRSLASDKKTWTRPVVEFTEVVDAPEFKYKGPRFTFISG